MKKYHVLYITSEEDIYSRGLNVDADDISTAIKIFKDNHEASNFIIIGVFDLEQLSHMRR